MTRPPTLALKIPPVIIGLALAGAMMIAARLTPSFHVILPGARLAALSLFLAGIVVAILGVASFRRAQTTVNPLRPELASTLVVAGLYARTRNPMYLGMLLVLVGGAVVLGHVLALLIAALFVPLMNRLQIIPEEKALTAHFGPAFTTYKSQVRRWL